MSDKEGKSPTEKLDDLYKWLLTPTTFLLLINWHMITYVITTVLQHEELKKKFVPPISPEDLLLAPRLTIYAVASFLLSIFWFLTIAMIRRWKIAAWLRIPSYLLLISTMSIIGFSFIWASEPFRRLPMLSGGELVLAIYGVSVVLSMWIFCWAHRGDRVQRESPNK